MNWRGLEPIKLACNPYWLAQINTRSFNRLKPVCQKSCMVAEHTTTQNSPFLLQR